MDVCVSLFKMIIRGMWMEWTRNYNIFREKQETEERKDSILKPRKMEISQRVIGIKRRNKMEHLRIVMQMFWRRAENRNTSFLLLKFTLENSQLKILKESRTEFTVQ